MIVEVPRWTNAKLEISKEEAFNPIKQGELGSFYHHVMELCLARFFLATAGFADEKRNRGRSGRKGSVNVVQQRDQDLTEFDEA